MYETIDDLTAPWMGNGVECARRMLALADKLEVEGNDDAARDIRDVIRCEYNPLPDQLPPLGDPPTAKPTLRAAAPGQVRVRIGPAESALRRRGEPGQ